MQEPRSDVGLQKDAVPAGNCGANIFASTFAGRDGEDANARDAEAGAVNASLPGPGVGVEFSGYGTRFVFRSLDGHRATVGFQEAEDALAFVAGLQGEDTIRNDAEFFLSRTRRRDTAEKLRSTPHTHIRVYEKPVQHAINQKKPSSPDPALLSPSADEVTADRNSRKTKETTCARSCGCLFIPVCGVERVFDRPELSPWYSRGDQ